ncbi:sporulation protein Cse60 [Bacillus cereus]|uniref:sporulation protein Cse60 n=1 Tax=Bacillus cereus TaxID=1396 RepID=UPI0032DF5A26
MNRVKVFDCPKISTLEEEINDFLETEGKLHSFELIDIKFNSYPYGEDRTDFHSAMVIYKV